MEASLKACGVEPENYARITKIIATLKAGAGCKTFDVLNGAESCEAVVSLYGPEMTQISARVSLSALARDCSGVGEAAVIFPLSGLDAPLEIRVNVLKVGATGGVRRYDPPPVEKIYLEERLRKVTGGDMRMPRPLLTALKAVATSVIIYSKNELSVRLTYKSGASRCVATFVGVSECSLSFLEHIFEKYGRRLVDVDLRSEGLERRLIVTLDTEAELAAFPTRKDSKLSTVESNKRMRTISRGGE